jgi:hypothetical protein
VLRFSTPTRAWVLDGSATFDRQHASGTDASETDVTLQSASVIARFGPRWYHAEYERVVRFVGLGVTGGYSNASGSAPGSSRLEYWSVGGYGELGLQYLFTRHLGLGGRADLVGWWTSNHSTQVVSGGSTTEHLTTYHVGLEPVQIIGTFYF